MDISRKPHSKSKKVMGGYSGLKDQYFETKLPKPHVLQNHFKPMFDYIWKKQLPPPNKYFHTERLKVLVPF